MYLNSREIIEKGNGKNEKTECEVKYFLLWKLRFRILTAEIQITADVAGYFFKEFSVPLNP